ncbi:MAG: response regulator transcription factor [bacterium]|nr:response regulator transcription factor [bacterium]
MPWGYRRTSPLALREALLKLKCSHEGGLGCEVTLAHDGNSGLRQAVDGAHDLIILDLMLPGIEGLEICRRVRARPGYTPILMLTAKSSELDRVLGLESGADDYLTKPFSIRELIARVKAIFRPVEALREAQEEGDDGEIRAVDLVIDTAGRTVRLGAQPVRLTAKEFDLLVHFARHPGRVYTRSELLDQVWGYGHDGYEHTVNSHINRLRAKIEENAAKPSSELRT